MDQKKHVESAENDWKVEQQRLQNRNEDLAKQKDSIIRMCTEFEKQLQNDNAEVLKGKDAELLNLQKQNTELLKAQSKPMDERNIVSQRVNNLSTDRQDIEMNLISGVNLIADSRLQKWVDDLPDFFKRIMTPKGTVTADELGMLMGTYVALTAYIVTIANKEQKITALSGFSSLCGLVTGTMFNNVITHISAVNNAEFKSIAVKSLTYVPWILLGGAIPIGIGGFIRPWKTRAIVTAIVTLVVKIIFA